MSAWTMMLCCSLRYFFSLLRTGPTSLLCLTGECESCLVRTRCASHSWRVESSPARTGRMIMLTVWLSDINILSSLPSLHIRAHQRPASALFYIHRQTDQERIKSVCLYFNKITQLYHQQSDQIILESSVRRLPNVKEDDLEIFSWLTEFYQE